MNVLTSLFLYLFFPGFLFSFMLSVICGYVDRKLTARIQYRQGPPLLQNLYDFLKLLAKEVVVPQDANFLFILAPFISLASVILASTILWTAIFFKKGFVGDIIVLVYILTIPSIALILGSGSSNNVIASIGVAREIKLLLSYELPLITSLLVAILKTKSLKLVEIMHNCNVSVETVIASLIVLITLQAKVGLVPFDVSEAETELASGVMIEYSGLLLGLIKLTKQIMFSLIPAFITGIYYYKGGVLAFIIKYILFLILMTLIRNTNPRLKIDQVIKFCWFILFPLALLCVILTLIKTV